MAALAASAGPAAISCRRESALSRTDSVPLAPEDTVERSRASADRSVCAILAARRAKGSERAGGRGDAERAETDATAGKGAKGEGPAKAAAADAAGRVASAATSAVVPIWTMTAEVVLGVSGAGYD